LLLVASATSTAGTRKATWTSCRHASPLLPLRSRAISVSRGWFAWRGRNAPSSSLDLAARTSRKRTRGRRVSTLLVRTLAGVARGVAAAVGCCGHQRHRACFSTVFSLAAHVPGDLRYVGGIFWRDRRRLRAGRRRLFKAQRSDIRSTRRQRGDTLNFTRHNLAGAYLSQQRTSETSGTLAHAGRARRAAGMHQPQHGSEKAGRGGCASNGGEEINKAAALS